MILFHGSPKNLKVLKPMQGKGQTSFENLNVVFLTKTFLHASLYAIGKTLKGKATFGISETKLVILEKSVNPKLGSGYVYKVEVDNPIKGPNGQFASLKELIPLEKFKVDPGRLGFNKNIFYVKSMDEMIKVLKMN